MAELEIHHEVGHVTDPTGQKVGILAAVLGVALGIVTIASHRAHTNAVILRNEATDQWAFYQSKRLKFYTLQLGDDLLTLMGPRNGSTTQGIQKYQEEKNRLEKESKTVMEEAREKEAEMKRFEQRALRYDFGEGLLEIGVVLSSLYFISRKKILPAVGLIAGILGAGIGVTGCLL